MSLTTNEHSASGVSATDVDSEGPSLRLSEVRRAFGTHVAVDGVSLVVRPNQIAGLIGPNGAGKSTIINLVAGGLALDSGTVTLGDVRLDTLPPYKVARAGVGRTFQTCRLYGHLSALENVLMASPTSAWRSVLSSATFGLRRDVRHELVDHCSDLLDQCGVGEFRNARADTLPYAHQRRVEIARALALTPTVLLLDEPAAGMNAEEAASLGDLLCDLAVSGHAILLVEHHVDLIFEISHEVTVVHFGQTIAQGEPAEVRRDPTVVEAYFGAANA